MRRFTWYAAPSAHGDLRLGDLKRALGLLSIALLQWASFVHAAPHHPYRPDVRRVLIVSDAPLPRNGGTVTNGTTRAVNATACAMRKLGHTVRVLTPAKLPSLVSHHALVDSWVYNAQTHVRTAIKHFEPDAVHRATEFGSLSRALVEHCDDHGLPWTASYHTDLLSSLVHNHRARTDRIPPVIKRFYQGAAAVLVPSESLRADLGAQTGLTNLTAWTHGHDEQVFRPRSSAPPENVFGETALAQLARPIILMVGRLSPEKAWAVALEANVPGTKVVVGEGPLRQYLESRFPAARFLGPLPAERLAWAYHAADVLAYPSAGETFGLAAVEALAMGTPVAIRPRPGLRDVVDETCGAVDENFAQAITRAQSRSAEACRTRAAQFTWERAAKMLLDALVPLNSVPTP